jgi:hypothetical protein
VQSKRLVHFTFEWNQDVSRGIRKFDKSKIYLSDHKGKRLQFESFGEDNQPAASGEAAGEPWYGAVARVEIAPGRRQLSSLGSRFVGSVLGPSAGFVQATVPANSFCSPTGLCNPASNQIRVVTQDRPAPCVQVTVEPSVGMYSKERVVPFTFTFSSDMKDFDFNKIRAYGFSYESRSLPSLALDVSHVTSTGSARQYVASIEAPSNPRYNRIEVFVRAGSALDVKGIPVCESNHWRMAVGVDEYDIQLTAPPAPAPKFVPTVDQPVPPHTHITPEGAPAIVLPPQGLSNTILRTNE